MNRTVTRVYLPTLLINRALILLKSSNSLLQLWKIPVYSRLDSAKSLLDKGKEIAELYTNKMALSDYYLAAGDWFEKKKDYYEANKCLKLSKSISDSIENVNVQMKVAFTSAMTTFTMNRMSEKRVEQAEEEKKKAFEENGTYGSILYGFTIFLLFFNLCIRFIKWRVPPLVIRKIAFIAILSLTESIQFYIHYFLHHNITDSPFLILLSLIISYIFIASTIDEIYKKDIEKLILEQEALEKEGIKKNNAMSQLIASLINHFDIKKKINSRHNDHRRYRPRADEEIWEGS